MSIKVDSHIAYVDRHLIVTNNLISLLLIFLKFIHTFFTLFKHLTYFLSHSLRPSIYVKKISTEGIISIYNTKYIKLIAFLFLFDSLLLT